MSSDKTIFDFTLGEERNAFEVQRINEKFAMNNLLPGRLFNSVGDLYPSIYDFEVLNKIFANNHKADPINLMHDIWTNEQLNEGNKNISKENDGWFMLLGPKMKIFWLENLPNKERPNPSNLKFHAVSNHVAGVRFFTVLTPSCKKAYLSYTTYSNRYLYEEIRFK